MNFPPFATDFDTFNFTREVVIYIYYYRNYYSYSELSVVVFLITEENSQVRIINDVKAFLSIPFGN